MTSPDVIVIGGGFAGLSAASALAARGARVLVADARPQLGGRATAFRDRHTGELVDNGQHVLFGCYRETLAFLKLVHADDRVRAQDSLELVCYDRAAPAIRSALPAAPGSAPPSCRRPQVAADPAEGPAERAASRPADSSGAAPAADVTDGLRRSARAHGAAVARSSPPGCDAPGVAVASARRRRPESAARRRGSRRIRAHPRRHVRTGSVGSGRRPAALPAARDVCRAGARFHHRPRWRSPDVGADARKRQQRASGRRRGARRAAHRGRGDCCCALVRPARALRRLAAPRTAGRARRGRRHGGDADRDGEPLVRPARHAGSLRGTAGADDAVGVRQADRVRRERLAPVAGLERRYRDRRDDQRGTLGARSAGGRSVAASGARSMADSRDGRAGEAGDVLAGARSAAASGHADRRRGLFLAGDWTDTGLPATIEGAVVSGNRAAAAVVE